MDRHIKWTAAALIGSFVWSICAVQAAVPQVESFDIELGQEFAVDIAPLEGGDRAVVLFAASGPTRKLALIDAVSRSVVEGPEGTFPYAGSPAGAVVGRRLYLTEWNSLASLDLDTKVITPLFQAPPVVGEVSAVSPVAVSASRRQLFTVAGGHVLSVDTATDEVVDLGRIQTEGYHGFALSHDEGEVYVTDPFGLLTHFAVDGTTEPETTTYVTPSGIEYNIPRVVAAHDGLIYAGYTGPEAGLPRFHLSLLDPLGNLLRNQIYPLYAIGMDLTPDGRFIILGNGDFIDRKSLGIVAHAQTGRGHNEVHVTADGLRAYVTNYNSTFATVIDLESVPLEVTVQVDSPRPPNYTNNRRARPISVAILSTPDFDPTTVDPASVCFGSLADPNARACVAARPVGVATDINRDGRADLLLRYDAASTGIAAADRYACLTGRANGNRAIAGCGTLEAKRH